ncbi:hypothetical protein IAR55_005848 [Kwoniella newhampshirensis]|uniref:SH3 domain-containing protein n=1 Tax=Kwoniella newhampshirensis TaxID=1651941 RepID=A0AAW0YUU9_9TREE
MGEQVLDHSSTPDYREEEAPISDLRLSTTELNASISTTTSPTNALEHHLSLQSSRPAPPSPSSSRPTSIAIVSPEHIQLSASSPSSLGEPARDRSGSTSSRGGRRTSGASSSTSKAPRSRASSRARPKSTLGTSFSLPNPSPAEAETEKGNGGLGLGVGLGDEGAAGVPSTVLENVDSAQASKVEMTIGTRTVVVKDFAYSPLDERHHGRGAPLPQRESSSTSLFKWPWKQGGNGGGDSPDIGGEEDEDGKKGWGGFGLLGWRGFGARGTHRSSSRLDGTGHLNGNGNGEDEGDEGAEFQQNDDGEEYFSSPEPSEMDADLLVTQNNLDPPYAFTVLAPPEDPDEEPKGLYRAAYAFEGLSSSEMSLEEGDLLMISGRGNGDPGWVIARRMKVVKGRVEKGDDGVGLVPEGYLERVEVVKDY